MIAAIIAAAGVVIAAASPAPSPSPSPSPGLSQIGGVTVSAGRGAELGRMDVSTTVIGRAQLEAMPEMSVDQILNTIPGIYVPQVPTNEVHPTAQIVSIRGIGNAFGTKTLVMVDGVPINDGYFRTIDWSQIPKDTIERIEVIRGGGATSLWGNLALGGVINIVTRAPRAGEQTVTASYGSFNTTALGASGTLIGTGPLRVGVNLDTTSTGGYNLTPSQYQNAANVATSSRANNAALSMYYQPSGRLNLYVRGTTNAVSESGLAWSDAGNSWGNSGLTGGGTLSFTDRAAISAYGWYTNNQYATQNATDPGYTLAAPALGTPYVSQVEMAAYHTYGGSAFLTLGDAKIGVDARTIVIGNDHNLIYNAAGVNTAVFNDAGTHQFEGIFAQDTLRLSPIPLEVTVGVREDFWQALRAGIFGTSLLGTLNNALGNQYYSHFDPRLGLKYVFGGGLFDVRAVGYANFSAPGMNQMYRSYVSGSSYNNSSPLLVPETNVGTEAGVDYHHGGTSVQATAYTNAVTNFIDYPSLCSSAASCAPLIAGTGLAGISTVRQYLNVGNATFKGLELIARQQIDSTLSVNAGYERAIAFLTSSAYPAIDPLGNQIGQVPPTVFVGGADWQASRWIHFTIEARAWPTYWYNTAHTQLNGSGITADASFAYAITSQLTAFVTAVNITNLQYYAQGPSGATTAPTLGEPLSVQAGVRLRK